MNKKSQQQFLGIMLFITVIVAVIALIPAIKNQIDMARNETYLNCSSPDESVMTRATCIVVDTTLFYFVGAAIASAGAYFAIRYARNN